MFVVASFIVVQQLRITLDWIVPFFLMSEFCSLRSAVCKRDRFNRVGIVDSRENANQQHQDQRSNNCRKIIIRFSCKLLAVLSYFILGAVSGFLPYQWMALLPVSIYYALRIVKVLVSAKFEFVYQIFVSIYMITLLLVVVQIQYFIKTKNDAEHGSSFGYLWPTKLMSLIIIVCTFTYFVLTMVSIC